MFFIKNQIFCELEVLHQHNDYFIKDMYLKKKNNNNNNKYLIL